MGLGPGLLLIWCGLGIGTWEAVSSAEAQALLKPVGSETLGWSSGTCSNTPRSDSDGAMSECFLNSKGGVEGCGAIPRPPDS